MIDTKSDIVSSPVPFGGVLFADSTTAQPSPIPTASCHQCLSAECCSRTAEFADKVGQLEKMSPVPFGGVLFADGPRHRGLVR